jgi:hypothetical protein
MLKEQAVADKESEQTRVEQVLPPVCVKGHVLTADAWHTHAKVCAHILASAGKYVLFARGNQSRFHQDLALFFREPPAGCQDWRTAQTLEKRHGRIEQRLLIASDELNDFLAADWPGVAQVFHLRRRFHHRHTCTQQIVYGFTSLSPQQATPERLLTLIREHWTIEIV